MPDRDEEGMEKYGVDETKGLTSEEQEKRAAKGCPRCGKELIKHGAVVLCPDCGSEPFEKG